MRTINDSPNVKAGYFILCTKSLSICCGKCTESKSNKKTYTITVFSSVFIVKLSASISALIPIGSVNFGAMCPKLAP